MTGKVKWFDRLKGFGFITRDDGKEYFVHYTGIVGEGHKSLYEGDFVSFEEKVSKKGPMAVNVVKELPII